MSRDEGSNEIMPEEGPDYVLAGSLAECEETVQEPRQPEDAELTEYELRETGEMPGEPEIEIRSDPQNNLTGPDIEPPTAQLDSGPQMDLFPDTPGGPLDSECPLGRQEKLPGLDGPPDLLNPTDGIG